VSNPWLAKNIREAKADPLGPSQPPQQLQAAVHGEAGWQAGPTGTCTVTFCGTILQTWTVTLLVTFTGTQTVYFSVCLR
jgi:hypothetical protein